MNQKEIADALSDTGALLELKGENQFKTRAYNVAAALLREHEGEVEAFVAECRDGKIKGIGPQLTAAIAELFEHGRYPLLDELRREFPPGILDLLHLPGLGPKKVKALFEELKITGIEELESACLTSRLSSVKGFGEKTQKKLLEGIAAFRTNSAKSLFPRAREQAAKILERLRSDGSCERAEIAGGLRRVQPVLERLDFVIVPKNAGEAPVLSPEKGALPAFFHVASAENFESELLRHTGSDAHIAELTALAPATGLRGATEAAIYDACGLAFIPPECREGRGEIALAKRLRESGKPFPRLLETRDLKGILHAHSTYSDGKHTLEEMARKTKELGYEYLGISDHSQSAIYANGLKPDAIKRQHAEIDRLNDTLKPFRIFKGIESDILADGRLDYPDEILALFDFVIVSIHSRFSMGVFEMTERIVQAIENPFASILAHPTGRLLLERDGYTFNVTQVLEAAAACGVAIEINSNPKRLDLDWEHLAEARELGVMLAICPDAHSTGQLANVEFGVAVARKGLVEPEHVLNCLGADELARRFEARKRR